VRRVVVRDIFVAAALRRSSLAADVVAAHALAAGRRVGDPADAADADRRVPAGQLGVAGGAVGDRGLAELAVHAATSRDAADEAGPGRAAAADRHQHRRRAAQRPRIAVETEVVVAKVRRRGASRIGRQRQVTSAVDADQVRRAGHRAARGAPWRGRAAGPRADAAEARLAIVAAPARTARWNPCGAGAADLREPDLAVAARALGVVSAGGTVGERPLRGARGWLPAAQQDVVAARGVVRRCTRGVLRGGQPRPRRLQDRRADRFHSLDAAGDVAKRREPIGRTGPQPVAIVGRVVGADLALGAHRLARRWATGDRAERREQDEARHIREAPHHHTPKPRR